MDVRCPGCGQPLASPDDICPRCALAQGIPPAVAAGPVESDVGRLHERRVLVGPDRNVQRSLRMLLVFGVGLVLLLFAVIAVLVWIFFA
jgi:hypothetical protein